MFIVGLRRIWGVLMSPEVFSVPKYHEKVGDKNR